MDGGSYLDNGKTVLLATPTTTKALTEILKHPVDIYFRWQGKKTLCFWKSEWSGASAVIEPEGSGIHMSRMTGWR